MAAYLALAGLLTSGAVDAHPVDAPPAPARPQWRADPLNVFVVIETGDNHVSLVDGDRLEVFHRFASRPVQGRPVFTPDGRFMYLASPDGWIAKYDIRNLAVVAEVRAGLDLSDVAVSGDGRWVMAANANPRTLALFDADLRLARTYPVTTLDGRIDSSALAVYDAAPRRSFIVVPKDLAELWEISYDVRAEPIFDGLVHDYRMGEGIAKPGFLGVRRVPLDAPMEALLFEPSYRYAIGAARAAPGDSPRAQVVNFDVRRAIAVIPVSGVPHLQGGVGFPRGDGAVLAYASLAGAALTVVDTKTWRIVKTIPTGGAGAYLSSHEQSAHVWVDFRRDPSSKDSISLIDKQALAPAGEVHEPGGTLAHVEFTRDGRHALASLQETDGAIIVFDTRTLREVKRLPMRKPAGNYNVGNRISHAGAGQPPRFRSAEPPRPVSMPPPDCGRAPAATAAH